MKLVWDSEYTGPTYVNESHVEKAQSLWDKGIPEMEIVSQIRSDALGLYEAWAIIKFLRANHPR